MLTCLVSFQLMLPIPDLDAVSQYEAGEIFKGILLRAIHDLRFYKQREDALAWFENGECRKWCQLLGYDFGVILARVEVELDKPVIHTGRPRKLNS